MLPAQFMNTKGFSYIANGHRANLLYAKDCKDASNSPGEPHIRIFRGHSVKDNSPYKWDVEEVVATNGMSMSEIEAKLAQYKIVAEGVHDEM